MKTHESRAMQAETILHRFMSRWFVNYFSAKSGSIIYKHTNIENML